MTYEKFVKAVQEVTDCSREVIARTARKMVIILASLAFTVGTLIGAIVGFGSILWSAVIFLILIFTFFSFVAEAETPETFRRCQMIGKLYPVTVILMLVAVFMIKLILK